MGMYASVRGWVEINHDQRSAAEEIIQRHQEGHYSGGWAFPVKPFNWTLYLFYGGDIREGELRWLHAQVTELAALPPIDEDGDRARGFFLITDERTNAVMWQIREGTVEELPAPSLLWLGE